MKINVTGSWWDTDPWPNELVYWGNYLEPPPINEDYRINGEASSYPGLSVCHSGLATGTTCGTVTEVNVTTNFGEEGGPLTYDTVKVTGDCSGPGDSGGPWFAGNIAYGINLGTDTVLSQCEGHTFYGEIPDATAALGVHIASVCGEPATVTGDAPEVRDSEALITGTVNPEACNTSFRFEYGPTTSYGHSIPIPDGDAGSGTDPVVVSRILTGLQPRSHYHYRLAASNASGTSYGFDRTFTTGIKWLIKNTNASGGSDASAWLGLPGDVSVSGDWDGNGTDTPGSYNPRTGIWRLSNSLSQNGKVDLEFQYGGDPWTQAVVGDWDHNGVDTIGVYDPVAGNWNLRNRNESGPPDVSFSFGGGPWRIPVAGDWNGNGTDTIGVYDPTMGNWNLRNSNGAGNPDYSFQYGGAPFTSAVAGDWNGDGIDTIGVHDPLAGNWNLRNSNSSGQPDVSFQFGGSQFGTVVGDWDGNGTSTVALTDPDAVVQRNWLLRNSNSSGGADLGYLFGLPGQIGVVGDWNGDGFKTLGTYEPGSGVWRLSNKDSGGSPDIEFQYGGGPWTVPVTGDWNGDGTDTIGVYDPVAGNWNLRNVNSSGTPDYSFQYGGGPWTIGLAGDWNGDGTDTIGVYDPVAGNWNLRNVNSSGTPDYSFQYGGGPWTIGLAGDWNGDGTDTIGVYDPVAGNWNLRNKNEAGGANEAFQFGGSQFQPIAADWDGNGTATPGLIADSGEVTTSPTPPQATTAAASGITPSQATLNGTVNPRGFATHYRFEWGATTAYGNSSPAPFGNAGSQNAPLVVATTINGLIGEATYHYRLVSESAEGKSVGGDMTLVTPDDETPQQLGAMPVAEAFGGTSHSKANFGSNWAKLGWASSAGEDTTSGWRSVAAYPTIQGAYNNTTVGDVKGAATAVTMATTPGIAERYFSLWLDMGSPTSSTPGGYELRFTYASAGTYAVTLSKWAAGTRTVLNTTSGVSFATGNSVALVDKGSTVSAWTDNGGGYIRLFTVADSTLSGGYGGVQAAGNATRLVNFKVGSVFAISTNEPGTTSAWNLRNYNKSGAPDLSFQFGLSGKKEVVGDWNGDGVDTVGTFDPSSGAWKLRNTDSPGPTEIAFTFGGGSYSVPIVGDWNGDGIDTVGAFSPGGNDWILRNGNFAGSPDGSFQFGGGSPKPIIGNWDGIGGDGIGIYYPESGVWGLRNCACGGNVDYGFGYGGGPWITPVAGDWNGDGNDTIGVYDPVAGNWNLRNKHEAGTPDYSFQYGGGAWRTGIVGDWNGDGSDTIGVANN